MVFTVPIFREGFGLDNEGHFWYFCKWHDQMKEKRTSSIAHLFMLEIYIALSRGVSYAYETGLLHRGQSFMFLTISK